MKKSFSTSALRAANNGSILDYILDSMCQAFEMNTTQAAALIANNQKFLVHLC